MGHNGLEMTAPLNLSGRSQTKLTKSGSNAAHRQAADAMDLSKSRNDRNRSDDLSMLTSPSFMDLSKFSDDNRFGNRQDISPMTPGSNFRDDEVGFNSDAESSTNGTVLRTRHNSLHFLSLDYVSN